MLASMHCEASMLASMPISKNLEPSIPSLALRSVSQRCMCRTPSNYKASYISESLQTRHFLAFTFAPPERFDAAFVSYDVASLGKLAACF
jgi:hypothetical protein